MGSYCLMGTEFQFCKMKTVLGMEGLMVAQLLNEFNAVECTHKTIMSTHLLMGT